MGKLNVTPLKLGGTYEVTTNAFNDHRGRFGRMFCAEELAGVLQGRAIVQINNSLTVAAGAVRGLHFQHPPHAEMKLVRCTRGRVWDVMVDIRKGSSTFLQWQAVELSADRLNMVIVPEGFAHGFQTLEENSELFYLSTTPYSSEYEAGLRPTDPALGIAWPLPVADLSARDAAHALVGEGFEGVAL